MFVLFNPRGNTTVVVNQNDGTLLGYDDEYPNGFPAGPISIDNAVAFMHTAITLLKCTLVHYIDRGEEETPELQNLNDLLAEMQTSRQALPHLPGFH